MTLRNAAPLAIVVALIAALLGAASGRSALAQTAPAATPSAEAAENVVRDYRLGPGDEVRITVYGEKDLTGEFNVSASGKISFPLIGEIEADGKTVHEIEAVVVSKLKQGYLVDPRVSAEVLVFRPFYILGEVNKPGQYPYTNGLTALKAVATAQGFTYRANTHKIFIRHPGEDKEHAYPLGENLYVQPGDTMRVAERFF